MTRFNGIIAENCLCLIQGIQGWLANNDIITSIMATSDWNEVMKLCEAGSGVILITTSVWITNTLGINLFKEFIAKTHVRTLCFVDKRLESNAFDLYTSGIQCLIGMDDSQEEFLWGVNEISRGKHFVSSELLATFIQLQPVSAVHASLHILTNREEEILLLIREGNTNKEIAARLSLSKRTIDGYRETILNKFGARNTAQLITLTSGISNFQR